VEDAHEKAGPVDYVTADRFKETIVGACPHCGAQAGGGKFCAECGQPLAAAKKFCSECGKEVKAGVKFCPECGAKQA
jgi:predicted amidophosphoribosyltransferase